MTQPFAQFRQGSEEWLQAKASIISATEASIIEGFNQYQSTDDLVRRKVRQLAKAPDEFVVSPPIEHGNKMEETARNFYTLKTGKKVLETGLVLHEDYDFIGASPDGLVGIDGALEIKCPFPKFTKEPYSVFDSNKKMYLWQCYHILEVFDLDWIDFLCYLSPSKTAEPQYHFDRVERQENWFKQKISAKLLPVASAKKQITRLDVYKAWVDYVIEESDCPKRRQKHLDPLPSSSDYEFIEDKDLSELEDLQKKISNYLMKRQDELETLDLYKKRSEELKNILANRFDKSVGNKNVVVQVIHKKPSVDYKSAFLAVNGEDILIDCEDHLDNYRRKTGTRQVQIKYGENYEQF